MSYVYIIRSGKTGAYKIGVAKNVKRRLESLQIGNPEKMYIIAKIDFKSEAKSYAIEKQLHKIYSRERIRGEWFNSTIELRRADAYLKVDFFEQELTKKNEEESEYIELDIIRECPF